MNVFLAWEVPLMQTLQAVCGAIGERLAVFFTFFGEEPTMLAIVGFLYWGVNKQWGKLIGMNFMAEGLCGSMIKNIVRRPRPYMAH